MYKVWLQIEKERLFESINYGEPICLGEFASAVKAQEFVDKLETIQPDKPVKKKRKPDFAP